MVGGGRGAFIGNVHRMAAALDGQIELVCGAFSSNPERSRLSGQDLLINPSRVYDSVLRHIDGCLFQMEAGCLESYRDRRVFYQWKSLAS